MRRRTGEPSEEQTSSASLNPGTQTLWWATQHHEEGSLAVFLLYWAEAKPMAHRSQPLSPVVRAAPGRQGLTMQPSPALPDGIGDVLHTDAVGGLHHGFHPACLPITVAPLQGGRHSARHRHLPVLGPCRLPSSRCWPGA